MTDYPETSRIDSTTIAYGFQVGINTLTEIAKDRAVADDTRVHAAYVLLSELKGKNE